MRTKHETSKYEIILNVYLYIVRCSIFWLIAIGIVIIFLINHCQWIIGCFKNENKYSVILAHYYRYRKSDWVLVQMAY